MRAEALTAASFAGYPREARELAVRQIGLLRELPVPLLAALLRELIDLDWRFPAERREIEGQLGALQVMRPEERAALTDGFARLTLPASLSEEDWVGRPSGYLEQLAATLWSTGTMPAYREAADAYAARMRELVPAEPPVVPRWCVVVFGQGIRQAVEQAPGPLFRRLRPHGVRLTGVRPEGGMEVLLQAAVARASHAGTQPYAHWYLDGGEAHVTSNAKAASHDGGVQADESKRASPAGSRSWETVSQLARPSKEAGRAGLTTVSYAGLAAARRLLLERAQRAMAAPKSGPEELRSLFARLEPRELGMGAEGSDPVVERFSLSLLTEGSGTQIFATTFAQWGARECLRRAQPETLLVRYAPRQRQRAMDELLRGGSSAGPDPVGSLVDAEVGAYYTYINLMRLAGADAARFLVWWEGHGEAVAIGPGLARGTESSSAIGMEQVLKLLG